MGGRRDLLRCGWRREFVVFSLLACQPVGGLGAFALQEDKHLQCFALTGYICGRGSVVFTFRYVSPLISYWNLQFVRCRIFIVGSLTWIRRAGGHGRTSWKDITGLIHPSLFTNADLIRLVGCSSIINTASVDRPRLYCALSLGRRCSSTHGVLWTPYETPC